MKTALLALSLLLSIGCKAQAQTLCGPNRDQLCIAAGGGGSSQENSIPQTFTLPSADQPVLKCGQYEHVQKGRPGYSGGACDGEVGVASCVSIAVWHDAIPDMCVEDMHEVTEKQWKALENAIELLKKMNLLEEEQIKLLTEKNPSPREPKP